MIIRSTLAALALIVIANPAIAKAGEVTTIDVSVADLDLTRSADRTRLSTRVKNAARSICHSGLSGVSRLRFEAACIKAAMASAQPQVDQAIARAGAPIRIARNGSAAGF
jgi:UrcA family protein